MVGELNVRFEFGQAVRPKGSKNKQLKTECLITAFATKAITAGSELLAAYGDAFWFAPAQAAEGGAGV